MLYGLGAPPGVVAGVVVDVGVTPGETGLGVTGTGVGVGATPGVTGFGVTPGIGVGVGVTPGVTGLGVTPGMGVGVGTVLGYGAGLGVTCGGNGFTFPGLGFLTSPGMVSVMALIYRMLNFTSGLAAIALALNMADTANTAAITLIFFITFPFV